MINFGRLPSLLFGKLPSLAQSIRCRIVAPFRRHHASLQTDCCPALLTPGNEPPAWPSASFGGQGRRPCLWLGPGIPFDEKPIKGSAAFVPSFHSGTYLCNPPQPRPSHRLGAPRSSFRPRSPASPLTFGLAGRQSFRAQVWGNLARHWKDGMTRILGP